jgi:hypothetical protein
MARRGIAVASITLLLAACGGEDASEPPAGASAEAPAAVAPAAPAAHAQRLLFGDLHIHTSYSPDAFSVGNRTLPDDAYRFAKGEQTLHAAGYPIRLKRALDFAAVTDHSEYMGVMPQLADPASPLSKLPLAQLFTSSAAEQREAALREVVLTLNSGKPIPELVSPEIAGSVWAKIVEAANRHYAPGSFTTLVGYEWTSTIDGDNLHRNVLFRSDRVPPAPFTSFDSPDPEKLWEWLEQYRAQGIESIAVPHNQNASNGRMFGTTTFDGRPFDTAYVARRLRNEPLHEIVQIKGQSEVHPELAAYDEFAQFEIFPITLKTGPTATLSKVSGSYVREALGVGLELGASGLGNPYRFGFIGSSDSHNSSSPVEEDNYHGKLPLSDGTPGQRIGPPQGNDAMRGLGRIFSAAGLAAVWASENTREAVFDALRRGETYATSGTRIRLRVFGGWGYEAALLDDPAWVDRAYAGGVPMGSDLPAAPPGATAPRLLIRAAKDPEGANLDRVQVVKGWLGADGKHREKIFEVAWAGERALDPVSGKLPAVGSTVDVAAATYANTIGGAELDRVWTDPEFDAAKPAFYYVRVLEIPTPRWSTFDAKTLGVAAPEPQVLQERAYSSPLWYLPPRA